MNAEGVRGQEARNDHVTGLPGRLHCLDHLQKVMAQGSEDRFLVLVTLSEAMQFNEILRALGHAFAEDFVRMGAARISERLAPGQGIFHVSVLSFAFVVDWPSGFRHGPPDPVEGLKRDFSAPLMIDGIPISTRLGIGVVELDADEAPAELLRAALAAAQDSRSGGEGWAPYDHRSDAAHQRAFRLLTDLGTTLDQGSGLSLQFQPRIDLASRSCCAAEALLRWEHSELGPVSPGEFIPLAEATALINPLTDWVLRAAVAQAAEWRDGGRGLTLSVNISTRNLLLPGFASRLSGLLEAHSLEPSAVELEIVESAFLDNEQTAQAELDQLRSLGFSLAIDDFGSGYSNLGYLTRFDAGTLKIDRSFVQQMAEPRYSYLVGRIVELSKGLGYRVVAEGIEDEESCSGLTALGCDEGQGYFISRPLPAARLAEWLARHASGWCPDPDEAGAAA